VLALLPCRTDASAVGWQHLHAPGLVPLLYHPCRGIQAVGFRKVGEIQEEPSQMVAEGWIRLAGFGINVFFSW